MPVPLSPFDHQDGYTALILASLYGHSEIVNLLIEAGADVKAINTVSAHHRLFFVGLVRVSTKRRGGEMKGALERLVVVRLTISLIHLRRPRGFTVEIERAHVRCQ